MYTCGDMGLGAIMVHISMVWAAPNACKQWQPHNHRPITTYKDVENEDVSGGGDGGLYHVLWETAAHKHYTKVLHIVSRHIRPRRQCLGLYTERQASIEAHRHQRFVKVDNAACHHHIHEAL
eukprot:TRINITY_DN74438_c0_g1_i1.p3 TRINITY_DN74438_c0_g1~~TRINITY_DN74438_c0_g1_i1.p3  ORF type:complete len:122 (-),score=3.33 TRINITY_DN74438_c0_g1_i1:332-697(-)